MEKNNVVKSVCFTGYRPEKFPFELNNGVPEFEEIKKRLYSVINDLIQNNCKSFYCGMARGFDILCGEAILDFKFLHNDLKLICVIPFEKQAQNFSQEWNVRYTNLIKNADKVIYLLKNYQAGCFHKRNRFMVDNCDYVITWYDGKHGGTESTLKYAEKKKCRIINLNPDFDISVENHQLSLNLE